MTSVAMTEIDPIDLLERRIAALELKVLPLQNVTEENMSSSVTDMLVQVNTLISSALSCREVVSSILNRMTELNDYLDPNFYDNLLDTGAKRQFILAIYPEIKKYGESIQKLKTLIPVLDSEPLNNVPSLVPKLEQLSLANMDLKNESATISRNIAEALQQYNDIIYSISRTFVQLEEVLTQVELSMKPKVIIE